MTIFELGALGEFVSSLAILVTLTAIYFQIRQQNNQQQADALDSGFRGFETVRAAVINNPDVADITLKMQSEPDSLNNIERVQAYSICGAMLWAWQMIHTRIRFGMLVTHPMLVSLMSLQPVLKSSSSERLLSVKSEANTDWRLCAIRVGGLKSEVMGAWFLL